MATPPLTKEQCEEAIRLVEQYGGNVVKAAAVSGWSRGKIDNRLRAAKTFYGLTATRTPHPDRQVAQGQIREPLASFEEAWQQWQRCIGMAKDRYAQQPNVCATTDPNKRKILVVPDLHAPFHEAEMFAAMLEAEQDADHCICIGDLGDAYALSRFLRYEHMPYRDEWASVTLVMQELASRFPKVTIILGNHDARLEKQLRTHLTEDMVDAISFMTGGVLCPITALARRYPNVEIAKHETPSGHTVDWFTTVGDAWLGHPEKFSRVAGSALRFTEEWIADNEVALGIGGCRLVVMGHTHAAAILPYRADKLLVECGCLAKAQGYMMSPKIGGRPQRRGYVTFTQHRGRTDLNSVRFRWLDIEQAA